MLGSMRSYKEGKLTSKTECEVRTDALTRMLYATDASIYQLHPFGVAFPKSPQQAAEIMVAAANEGLPVTPRGAGTGLAGGAVGSGLIVDYARYNRRILDFDSDTGVVRVEAGVVLDQLNAFLRPHGLRFGPDVATSSRATLGGMINNNSSGSHAPLFGTTVDHVRSLDIVLADGTTERVGRAHNGLADLEHEVGSIILRHIDEINRVMPEGLVKRWPGYGFDRWLRHSRDTTKMIGGSEGTLAIVTSAELSTVPLPTEKGLGVIFFASVTEAMQATVELLKLEPAAIEHVDRILFDQTRGQLPFKRARALLELDTRPCEAFLLVEFFDGAAEKLAALQQMNIGLNRVAFTDDADMEAIWGLRKAGLSLLTGCKGDAKPTAGIEDVAIMPEKLPEYVAGLKSIMEPLGLEGSFYGHAASGLLHVRPVVDMHKAEDIKKFRALADEVSALTKQFKGSLCGEHGVGIARTEFLPDQLGPTIMEMIRDIKHLFDPKGMLNPGKITGDRPAYSIDRNLRQGAGRNIKLPFEPVLAFAAKDESFVGNLEQCNGCGGCRKDAPTMCPTYQATGEESMSTRGRANTIRAALEMRHRGAGSAVFSAELEQALSNCLSCKACTTECPSNVNLSLLKAELTFARMNKKGITAREKFFSQVDVWDKRGSQFPRITNAVNALPWARAWMEQQWGISSRRPLPAFATERFDAWFARRNDARKGSKGTVVLWDDCFARYHDPQIGQAAVRVLEAAGYTVALPEGRECCGRPAFSTGRLDRAKQLGEHNAKLMAGKHAEHPVVFLEPSCYSMFAEDYRELNIDGAADLAKRSFLFEEFVSRHLTSNDLFRSAKAPAVIHGHCHAKAIAGTTGILSAADLVPNASPRLLDTGCCGMAGSFGMLKEKYDLSVRVAQPLVDQLKELPPDTAVIATGTSCRHQIEHLGSRTPQHITEYLAGHLK
jgi:FAD/FMN-containing dehydrogenase/Fe-S oxidoreductase